MLGSLISAVIGGAGQVHANRTNRAIAREQMDFQERMSNTSWQRGVKDMEAAGINPMLAVSQGPASSPQGASTHVDNVGSAAVSSARSGADMTLAAQQVRQSEAQMDLLKAQADKVRSETMDRGLNVTTAERRSHLLETQASLQRQIQLSEAQRPSNIMASTRLLDLRSELTNVQRQLAELSLDRDVETFSADVARRKAESQSAQFGVPRAKAEAEFWQKADDLPQWMRMAIQVLNGLSSARAANR